MIGTDYEYHLNIGQGSVLSDIHITTPDRGIYKNFDITLESNTEIVNGSFTLANECIPKAVSHYYLGSAKASSKVDLNGAKIHMNASAFSCSQRYVP